MRRKRLRTGFTTGSAVSAGAKAGILSLARRNPLSVVDIPLPDDGRLLVPVEDVRIRDNNAKALVIKDGGDDPDATHGARIYTTVSIDPDSSPVKIIIRGGRGVGRVTKPGLPVPMGSYAINPAPIAQIKRAVQEALNETGLTGTVTVTIDVPEGKKIALKTLNPRLGIVGGISILGTRGTVVPFSHDAYTDTISLCMDIARAEAHETVVLSTGGRTERLIKSQIRNLPDTCFIQVGDFFAYSLREARERGFKNIIYACFFGKLLKMAQGISYTHARSSKIDFNHLAWLCAQEGMGKGFCDRISRSNTAREALEMISSTRFKDRILHQVVSEALKNARRFSRCTSRIQYFLFSAEGELLIQLTL
jgi:cobalt-precorrin-5B (C1)-methyltransferase